MICGFSGSSGRDDAPGTTLREDADMAKRAKRLRELRLDLLTIALLLRRFSPHLLKAAGDGVRTRAPSRRRTTGRPVRIGAFAVGVAAAGVAAARLAGRRGPEPDQ
jgi:hypothetical protein